MPPEAAHALTYLDAKYWDLRWKRRIDIVLYKKPDGLVPKAAT